MRPQPSLLIILAGAALAQVVVAATKLLGGGGLEPGAQADARLQAAFQAGRLLLFGSFAAWAGGRGWWGRGRETRLAAPPAAAAQDAQKDGATAAEQQGGRSASKQRSPRSAVAIARAALLPGKYTSQVRRVTLHIKVPWAHPSDLPNGFLERASSAVAVAVALPGPAGAAALPPPAVVGAAIREGCIELVLDVVVPVPGAAAAGEDDGAAPGLPLAIADGMSAALAELLASGQLFQALDLEAPEEGSEFVLQALGQHFKCSAASAEQLDAGSAAWAVQVKQLALADIPSIQRLSPRVVLAGQAAPVTFTVGGRSLPRRDLDPAADGHAAPVAVSPRGPGRRELLVRGQGRVHACTVRCAPNAADLPAEGGAEAGRVPEELHLVLPVGATAAGLLLVEARNGTLAGGAAPVLAVPTSDVLAELQQALHDAPTGSCDALLHDLGLILECFASAETTTAAADAAAAAGMPRSALPGPGPAATATPVPAEAVGLEGGSVDAQAMVAQMLAGAGHRQRAEAVACRLLAHAVDQGWRATAGMLLRGLRSNLGMPLSEVQGRSCSGGLTLLHLAVRSGSRSMVRDVLAWGEELEAPLRWDALCDDGLSPLHLAAVMPDGGVLAQWATQEYEAARRAWTGTLAGGSGATPADLFALFALAPDAAAMAALAQQPSTGLEEGGPPPPDAPVAPMPGPVAPERAAAAPAATAPARPLASVASGAARSSAAGRPSWPALRWLARGLRSRELRPVAAAVAARGEAGDPRASCGRRDGLGSDQHQGQGQGSPSCAQPASQLMDSFGNLSMNSYEIQAALAPDSDSGSDLDPPAGLSPVRMRSGGRDALRAAGSSGGGGTMRRRGRDASAGEASSSCNAAAAAAAGAAGSQLGLLGLAGPASGGGLAARLLRPGRPRQDRRRPEGQRRLLWRALLWSTGARGLPPHLDEQYAAWRSARGAKLGSYWHLTVVLFAACILLRSAMLGSLGSLHGDAGFVLAFAACDFLACLVAASAFGAYARNFQALGVACTITRIATKCLTVAGVLRYPLLVSQGFTRLGLDGISEGLLPAACQQLPGSIAVTLASRALEAWATACLYAHLGLLPLGCTLAWAAAWNGAAAALAVGLDLQARAHFLTLLQRARKAERH